MKRNRLFLSSAILLFLSSAFVLLDDVFTRLGIQEKTARYYIFGNTVANFSSGPIENYDGEYEDNSFKLPYAKLLKDVVAGDKVAAAKELCEYTRNYVNSEEFIADYMAKREDALPLEIEGARISTLRANIRVHNINIKNYQSDTKYVAEQQAEVEKNQKKLDILLEKAKGNFEGRDKWEAAFPEDPSVLVKQRLEEYLKLVSTVDFNAQLADKDGRKRFVNPAYEKKSNKWKACFRAGKEVNEVVTAFVKNWLKGEIVAKNKIKMPIAPAVTASKTPAATNTSTSPSTPTAPASASTSSTASDTPPAAPATDKQPAKEKKSLFNKLKEKTKAVTDVIKN